MRLTILTILFVTLFTVTAWAAVTCTTVCDDTGFCTTVCTGGWQ